MEQPKAMEYGSRKASPDVLKPHARARTRAHTHTHTHTHTYIYIYTHTTGQRKWSRKVRQYWTHGKKKRGGKTRQLNPQGKLLWLNRTYLKSPIGSGPLFWLVHPKHDDSCVLNVSLVLLYRTAAGAHTETIRAAMKIIL
jgi:hypothetical protein